MLDINIHHLKLFYYIGKHLSITKAANALNISQSAVSLQLKNFQKSCGVKVVEIIGKQIYLTPFGKSLYFQCEKLFLQIKDVEELIIGNKQAYNEVINIHATSPVTEYYFCKVFMNINKQFPAIYISLLTGKSDEIIKKVANLETDMGIVGKDPKYSDLIAKSLLMDSLSLVCSPKHELADKVIIHSHDFEKHNLILHEEGSTTRVLINDYAKQNNIRLNVIGEIDMIRPVLELVKDNVGISILSRYMAKEYIDNGSIKAIPIHGGLCRYFYLIYHRKKYLSPSMKQVIDQFEKWSEKFKKDYYSANYGYQNKKG